ncbi:MAG: citrate (Si)-synthase, partial [Actinomycetota bacterium]|nr:citrate (Si)-synthase [Actinomycetota bacterium]
STFYLDAKDIFDPASRQKQIMRLIAKMPTLAAAAHRFSVGMPFVYPDNTLDFPSNFLSMMWKVAEPHYQPDPALSRALDILFILHADHEQNCSTTAMR